MKRICCLIILLQSISYCALAQKAKEAELKVAKPKEINAELPIAGGPKAESKIATKEIVTKMPMPTTAPIKLPAETAQKGIIPQAAATQEAEVATPPLKPAEPVVGPTSESATAISPSLVPMIEESKVTPKDGVYGAHEVSTPSGAYGSTEVKEKKPAKKLAKKNGKQMTCKCSCSSDEDKSFNLPFVIEEELKKETNHVKKNKEIETDIAPLIKEKEAQDKELVVEEKEPEEMTIKDESMAKVKEQADREESETERELEELEIAQEATGGSLEEPFDKSVQTF